MSKTLEIQIFLCDTHAINCPYRMSILWLLYPLEIHGWRSKPESLSVVMQHGFISKDLWTPRISFWSTQNPLLIHEFPLHGLKLVCCVLWVNLGYWAYCLFVRSWIHRDTCYIFWHHPFNTCPITKEPMPFFSKILCKLTQKMVLCVSYRVFLVTE